MKKWIKGILFLAVILFIPAVLAGCGQSKNTVKIGVVGSDDANIWKPVAKDLKKEGIDLKIVTFTDYNQPNIALKQKEIDLNAYQNYIFQSNWNKANHSHIVALGKTYLQPMAIYSKTVKSLKDVKKGSKVTLPNDVTNEARGLKVLAAAGLIKLDNASQPSTKDVTENKLNLKLSPLDAAQVPRTLQDAQLAVINSNYAIDAGLNPKTSLYAEKFDKNSYPYINIISANKEDANNKIYKKVVAAYQTEANKKRILKIYKGASIPAWDGSWK